MKIILLILTVLLSACVQEVPIDGETFNPIDRTPNTGNQADVLGYQGVYFEYTPDLGSLGGGYSYSATSLPSWASINGTSGKIFGIPNNGETTLNVVVTATDGSNTVKTEPFSIGINYDPLVQYSWFLNNSGQNNFASFSATIGADINMTQSLEDGLSGSGILIAFSDSGVELNHSDLSGNANASKSKNYNNAAPYYAYPTPATGHGTAVAGIAAAVGWNNIGGRGVAGKAQIAGFRFLDSAQTTAILIDQADGDYDIFNYSYGDFITSDVSSSSDYLDQIQYQALTGGRAGKGSVFVKASGNEYENKRSNFLGAASAIVPHNANAPLENESPYLIVVGALDAHDQKAFYSNVGSNMWISGYGGDFGISNPALMTTDLSGCSEGYSSSSTAVNAFEFGHSENSNCNFTSQMNGSSGATPMISGAIALILEANPNLTARDVKHILALTARKVQATHSVVHPTNEFNLTGYQYERGWQTNGAGLEYNNWFGFGAIDVDAAVAMAQNPAYTLLTAQTELNSNYANMTYSFDVSLAIPDNNKDGVTSTYSLGTNLTVEAVQIEVSATHTKSGELGIELTSPSGTTSILMNINNSFLLSSDANLSKLSLTSNAFYGESSQGVWTLRVIDGMSGNTGTLTNWKLNVLGR